MSFPWLCGLSGSLICSFVATTIILFGAYGKLSLPDLGPVVQGHLDTILYRKGFVPALCKVPGSVDLAQELDMMDVREGQVRQPHQTTSLGHCHVLPATLV